MIGLNNLLLKVREQALKAEDDAMAEYSAATRQHEEYLRAQQPQAVNEALDALTDATQTAAKKVKGTLRRQYLQDTLKYWYALARERGVSSSPPELSPYEHDRAESCAQLTNLSNDDFDQYAKIFRDAIGQIASYRCGGRFLERDLRMNRCTARADDLVLILQWLAAQGHIRVEDTPYRCAPSASAPDSGPTLRIYSTTEQTFQPDQVEQAIRVNFPLAAARL